MQHSISQQALQQQVLHKALLRLTEKLHISQKELAAITGTSGASMSRFYDGKYHIRPDSKEGELALTLLRIYRSLDALCGGNQQQCRIWYHSPNQHLQDTPANKVKTIQGLMAVANYLDALRGKA